MIQVLCDNCGEVIIDEQHHYQVHGYSQMPLGLSMSHEVHYHENCFNAKDILEIMDDTTNTPIVQVVIQKHNFPVRSVE